MEKMGMWLTTPRTARYPDNGHHALQDGGGTATECRGYKKGGREKSKNWKTNPSLIKPAWKFVPDKAKNEPICRTQQRRLVGLGLMASGDGDDAKTKITKQTHLLGVPGFARNR
jgi:hypothetical protein